MPKPIELAELSRALGVERGELVALVGGGGKTTTLFALGQQLTGTTVLTTTTKMGAEQSSDYQTVLIDPSDVELRRHLAESGRALAWKAADGRRAVGVSAQTCDRWFTFADNVIVEADGSRKRPFKAPAAHEPVIPSRTTLLVACIGASAFGRPISETCHRPHLVAALAGCGVDDWLTPDRAAAVLRSPNGSQKGRPAGARFVVALHRVNHNQADLALALSDRVGDCEIIAVQEHTDM